MGKGRCFDWKGLTRRRHLEDGIVNLDGIYIGACYIVILLYY